METHFTIIAQEDGRFQKGCLQEKKTDKAVDLFEHVKTLFTFLADNVGWISERIIE